MSKRKQCLYEKILKQSNDENHKIYKMCKTLFEKFKNSQKGFTFKMNLKSMKTISKALGMS